jgi:hypothetical protein
VQEQEHEQEQHASKAKLPESRALSGCHPAACHAARHRQTDRQTDGRTDMHTARLPNPEHGQAAMLYLLDRERQAKHTHTHTHTHKYKGRQTDTQTDAHTYIQPGVPKPEHCQAAMLPLANLLDTNRQGKHTHIHTHICKCLKPKAVFGCICLVAVVGLVASETERPTDKYIDRQTDKQTDR